MSNLEGCKYIVGCSGGKESKKESLKWEELSMDGYATMSMDTMLRIKLQIWVLE